MCSEEIPEEILESNIFHILESENVTKIGALYKISKFILILESKTAKEKLENTEILSHSGDYDLTLTAIPSSQKNGKEPTFATFFFPEYISDQALDLLSPNSERSCLCLKADTSLIGTLEKVKGMSKFSQRREIQ